MIHSNTCEPSNFLKIGLCTTNFHTYEKYLWTFQTDKFCLCFQWTTKTKNHQGPLNFSKNIVSLVHHGAYCALMVHIAPSWCTSTPYTVVVVYNVAWVNPDRQTDRHTYSGDIWPTRTCVPYVLLAMVWRHLLHHQFFIRMKNTCEPKNNCNSVTHSNTCEPINPPCDPFKYM